MKRLAIPVINGELSEYFGKCSHYQVFDISGNQVKENVLEIPELNDIMKMPEWAKENGITDIISYKLDKKILMLFTRYKINLFIGISKRRPEELLEEFIEGTLVSDQSIIKGIIESE